MKVISALIPLLTGCVSKASAFVEAVSVDDLCAFSDVAFVGKVLSLDTNDDEDPYGYLTYGEFDVERIVTGEPVDPITVVVRGGRIGTKWERVSGYPFLEVGDRYFFALGEERQDGSRSIVAWAPVKKDGELPTQADIYALKEQYCNN